MSRDLPLHRSIRPANPRTVHGLRSSRLGAISVSAGAAFEDTHADPFGYRLTGMGMDAPEDIPLGSLKAGFAHPFPGSPSKLCVFQCQRTKGR